MFLKIKYEGKHFLKYLEFSYNYYTNKFAKEAKMQLSIIHVYTFAMESAVERSNITYIAAMMFGKFPTI